MPMIPSAQPQQRSLLESYANDPNCDPVLAIQGQKEFLRTPTLSFAVCHAACKWCGFTHISQLSQMTMNIKCPHCGKALLVAEQHLGKQVKCPGCSQILQIQAKKPVPVPQQIVQEEPLLASVVEEPLMASNIEETSQVKSKWPSWYVVVGALASIFAFSGFLVVIVLAFATPNFGTRKSTGPSPLPTLIPPDTFCSIRANAWAYYGPSEESGIAGRLNGGAGTTVISDDGSGWVELDGPASTVYKCRCWVRWPSDHSDAQYVDFKEGEKVYIRKGNLEPHPMYRTWAARPLWDYNISGDR